MKFSVKDMDVATGGILVVVLHAHDADRLDLHHGDRIRITHGAKHVEVLVDIAESERSVPIGYIGLFEEVLDKLGVRDRETVHVTLTEKPVSLSYIRKKLGGAALSAAEIRTIVADIVENRLTDIELTYYVAANYTHGMSMPETVALTRAMIDTGETLKIKNGKIVDIHCIGGVAGNRTTLLVVPLLIAAGLTVPKTSSRAITSPAGTADTMEVICKVDLPVLDIRRIVKKVGGCIVWGGAVNLAPADDLIIAVEHPLSIDPEGQLLASIMAKKGSMGVTHLLLDIPIGPETKIADQKHAKHLTGQFHKLAKELKIGLSVIVTDGTQPIGNGIGPILEIRDALWALQGDARAPQDLITKSISMAGSVLEQCGVTAKGNGAALAAEILRNGKALDRFRSMVEAQHGALPDPNTLKLGMHRFTYAAPKSGTIRALSNTKLSKIARLAGCPKDRAAGVYLHAHVGAKVKKGQPVMTVYAESRQKLDFALDMFKEMDGIEIR